MDVGHKIKQIRTYKKMTQAELAEGIVTRNMLSAIENQKALPSLTVLKMLAEKLGVSCDLLLSDEELKVDISLSLKKKMPQIKKLFAQKKYSELYSILSEFRESDDFEVRYIRAVAAYNLSIEAFYGFDKSGTQSLINEAKDFFAESGFDPALFYCNFFDRIQHSVFEGDIPTPAECSGDDPHFVETVFYLYIVKLIKSGHADKAADVYDSVKLTFEPLRYHINSLLAASKFNINRAKELLCELLRITPNLPLPFKKIVYSELEHYCTLTGDYKLAYECAIEKNNLAKKI